MQILFKFKLFVIAISLLISGHAPWGQHEVYRQMHMLLMCSKNDNGAVVGVGPAGGPPPAGGKYCIAKVKKSLVETHLDGVVDSMSDIHKEHV